MPATSQAQARFFRWAEHNPQQAKSEGKATGMSKQQMHDFAATPEKGLPHHAPARAANGSVPVARSMAVGSGGKIFPYRAVLDGAPHQLGPRQRKPYGS